jgi:hypothetical protein
MNDELVLELKEVLSKVYCSQCGYLTCTCKEDLLSGSCEMVDAAVKRYTDAITEWLESHGYKKVVKIELPQEYNKMFPLGLWTLKEEK